MKRSTILALTVLFLVNIASGFGWTPGYYDFGDTPFDANNNTAPIDYPYGIGTQPSPGVLGEGGEKFDEEGFFVAFDDDYMYVALTNSFGLTVTSSSWGSTYEQGDIFFGTSDNTSALAINVSNGELYGVSQWSYIDDVAGSYYDDVAIRERIGAYKILSGSSLGTANQQHTFWENLETNPLAPGDGDTHVLEWKIDRNLFNWDGNSNLFFHTTLGCGNDLIEYTFPGIPEPGTMMLFGLGLCGVGFLKRRK